MNLCRHCGAQLMEILSLGKLPLANAFLDKIEAVELLPLNVFYCRECKLMQLEDVEKPENIFNEKFKYFSSCSASLINHSIEYCEIIRNRLNLKKEAVIVEVASNDGYLLEIFKSKGYDRIMGIEPSFSVAQEAINRGIYTEVRFFNLDTALDLLTEWQADLIIANNVMAHVPDINSFVKGIAVLLKEKGTATVEFQYLMELLKKTAFDMIYHEHFSYLSLHSVKKIMEKNGLMIYDVEKLSTQGGSLRVYAARKDAELLASDNVKKLLDEEKIYGIDRVERYLEFAERTALIKEKGKKYIGELKKNGKKIACYGAAAKGSTFLNYLGIDDNIVDYVVDKNKEKQGYYMAGSNLKVYSPEYLKKNKPDYVLILPWNIKDEIMRENRFIKDWGGRFLVMMPEIEEL
jgi:SAM-dependent methyltransferase